MWTASGLSLRLRIDDNLRQPGVKPPARFVLEFLNIFLSLTHSSLFYFILSKSWIRSLTESNSFVRPFEWMENNIENQWK